MIRDWANNGTALTAKEILLSTLNTCLDSPGNITDAPPLVLQVLSLKKSVNDSIIWNKSKNILALLQVETDLLIVIL